LDALLEKRLILSDAVDCTVELERDEQLRAGHWRALSAAHHCFSRWRDVDTGDEDLLAGYRTMPQLREKLGAPPLAVLERGDAAVRIALPMPADTALDALLRRRATCRNFDRTRALPVALLSTMLRRAFGAQAEVAIGDDTSVLKKLSPSGGGLHPTEAYVIVQYVDGVAPGLYHYQARAHALEPIATMDNAAVHAFASQALAGQAYFADAHAIVAMTCRFRRSFWKYRDHAKGYRAVVLDVGHLSQTLYVSATELGLGAYITAAVNETVIEHAFGLDPLLEGPIALAGFGWRGDSREYPEFDPFGLVWPRGA
jgi:putative peptide maturation dehydrogenase